MTVNHDDAARRLIRYRAACRTHGEAEYSRRFFIELDVRHADVYTAVDTIAIDRLGSYTANFLAELFLRHGPVADDVFDAITPNRIDTTSVAAVIPFERNRT